jgi:hypothetical protein
MTPDEEARWIAAQARADRVWHGLPPERDEAAKSTVEALMYELREFGIEQLKKQNTQRRLTELSDRQLHEIVWRLEKLKAQYPRIDDALVSKLKEQIK